MAGRLDRLRPWQKRLLLHLVVLLIYLLITALALNNLVLHFWDAVPDDGIHHDYAIFIWDMWWMRYSLLELRTSPFETDYIVYPFTSDLTLHTLAPFWGLLSIPLQSFMPITVTLNMFIVLSLLLTAYLTFFFVLRHTDSWSLSMLSGAIVAFTPAMVYRAAHGHLSVLPMWWVPLSLLACDWLCSSKSFWAALGLGLCAYAGVLADLQYAMWVPMVLVPYLLAKTLSPEIRSDGRRFRWIGARLLMAGALFAGLMLLYPVSQVIALDSGDRAPNTLDTAHAHAFHLSTLIRYWDAESDIGLALVPLAILAGILGKRQKRDWVWLLIAAGSMVLALGPYLSLAPYAEPLRWPMPYRLLHDLLGGQYRTPVRFAFLTVFSLSVFVALRGQAALQRFRLSGPLRLGLACGLLLVVVADYRLLRPFPISTLPDYDAYYQVAQDPRDVVLLEVPLGVDLGYGMFGYAQQLTYYQSIHEKRVPSGAHSRLSNRVLKYLQSSNFLRVIAGDAAIEPATADELSQLIDEWNIGYVFMHRDLLDRMLNQEYLQELGPFFATHPSLCFWQVEGDLVTYKTRPAEGCAPMEPPIELSFGTPLDVGYVGAGWYPPEDIGPVRGRWAGGSPVARLRFDLHPQEYHLRFRAWAYPPGQVVTVRVNDIVVAEIPLAEAWADYQATVPATAIEAGKPTYIELEHAVLLSAHERTQGESPDQRPLGAAYEWLVIEP
jgi:hypothetical protein